MSIISHMREKMRLNYGEKDNIEVYNFILDYYWVIRIIWNKYWIKPPKSSREFGSRLLTPLGLGGLAFLMEDIAPLEIRKLNRKDRIRELFKRFFRISDDIDWTEMKLNEYKNLRGDLLRFVSDILLPVYEAQIHEHVPDDELKDLLELLPEEFISTFEIEEGN